MILFRWIVVSLLSPFLFLLITNLLPTEMEELGLQLHLRASAHADDVRSLTIDYSVLWVGRMCTRFWRYAWPKAEHLASELCISLSNQTDTRRLFWDMTRTFAASKSTSVLQAPHWNQKSGGAVNWMKEPVCMGWSQSCYMAWLKLFKLMCTPTFGDCRCIQRDCSIPEQTSFLERLVHERYVCVICTYVRMSFN